MKALLIVLVLGPAVLLGAPKVNAEEPICPAVYPCDDRGNVMAPFNEGECSGIFETMCLSGYVAELEDKISKMHETVDNQASEIKELTKRNQRLKRKVRRKVRG